MNDGRFGIPDGYGKLKGDASGRSYYRGHGHILAKYPIDGEESFDNYLFWSARYRAAGIPVPEILRYDRARMEMYLEDWGNTDGVNWFHQLGTAEEKSDFVRSVYRFISLIRNLDAGNAGGQKIRLKQELDFFLNHAGDTIFRNLDISWLVPLCAEIARVLEGGKWVLSHRDYHFRNILVRDGEVCIIDFQDTRPAPEFYDNVSLLFDNYLDLGEMIPELEPAAGSPALRWAALQRNLKALGTFSWFGYKTGKKWFRDSVPLAMRHVLSHLRVLGLKNETEKWRNLMESAII
ncbi:MAG: phosphotransferase [Acidobacteria bacterium]|nr:phosphotransferase [Acidobacteriota bacterium]